MARRKNGRGKLQGFEPIESDIDQLLKKEVL